MKLPAGKQIAEGARRDTWSPFDLVEVFGASGALVRGFENTGFEPAPAFDVRNSEEQNIHTRKGLELLARTLGKARRGALVFIMPTCGGWIYLSRGSTLRGLVLTGYAGCMTVLTGNAVAELVSVWLLPLVEYLELEWIVEQPVSSLFFSWPKLVPFLLGPKCSREVIDLTTFGAISSKQLVLQGTWSGLAYLKMIECQLQDLLPSRKDLDLAKASEQSGRWITGNEYTSYSCVYPDCFGFAVGFAESMRLMVDMGGEEPDLHPVSKQWALVLKNFHYQSLEEAKQEADEAIARLKASGKKSFDMDPGWPGIEHDLVKIPIQTRRAWLKEKRDTGKFDNHVPTRNESPRRCFFQVTKKTKASSSSSKTPVQSLKITSFFLSRSPGQPAEHHGHEQPAHCKRFKALKPIANCIDLDD
eukprot:s1312_g18.t2